MNATAYGFLYDKLKSRACLINIYISYTFLRSCERN